jgi:hypothetical protein
VPVQSKKSAKRHRQSAKPRRLRRVKTPVARKLSVAPLPDKTPVTPLGALDTAVAQREVYDTYLSTLAWLD